MSEKIKETINTRTAKAWAAILKNRRLDRISNGWQMQPTVFCTKAEALVFKEAMDKSGLTYEVMPCTISYTVTKPQKKEIVHIELK
jgi:hypothetical protein